MKLPAPFYRDAWATIYHDRAHEILPLLPLNLVCITDQPYGTGWVRGGRSAEGEFDAVRAKPDWDVWDLSWIACLRGARRIAAFAPASRCEELCAALPNPGVLYYRKTNVRPGGLAREPIVVSPPPGLDVEWTKSAYNGDTPLHPCQKPMEVMTWLVESLSRPTDLIVDPFMGSGTTLLAAKTRGRRSVGIEISEEYCRVAAKRLAESSLPLFDAR